MQYSIRLESSDFAFTATHAIRYADGTVESAHRHRFLVKLAIDGPLNSASYVVDFVLASSILKDLLALRENETLLPGPDFNPTAEAIATQILEQFRREAEKRGLFEFPSDRYPLMLELQEETGMWAVCRS